ncbi:MAG: livH 4 [Actinomycetia bacterium]|nr:livH 4 [Actinomycetes bacterium]
MHTFLAFTVVGIVTGAIYAVAASGLVVTYTTSGVFNFAHGAIGMFMAFVYWELRVHQHWPAPLALVVVLLVLAPLLGALIERVLMRKLYSAPMGVAIVVTLALLVILLGVAESIWSSQEGRRLPEFFAGHDIRLFDVRVTYHQLIVLAVAALTAAALRFLMFHTRTGVTMRAVVDNRDLAAMNGVLPERVAQLSWALGSMLAALAGILIAPSITLNHILLTLLVINGYAAAMLGRLRNLPLTFVGALILGLAQAYVIGFGGNVSLGRFRLIDAAQVIPTIFLFGILVFLPQVRLPAGRLVAAAPPRVPSLRQSTMAALAFIAVLAVVSGLLSEFWVFNISLAFVIGLVALSLVLLSGYAGQVSLMQMTFVGVGVLTAGRFIGNGSIVGIVAAGLVAAAFGALVALPALRLQELYLALTTLAVALFSDWAFNQSWGFSQGGSLTMKRLHLPGLSFESERAQLLLVAVAFCGFGLLVLAIRRGPYGRRLAALRDSPVAASMLGMNLVATKTTVFALSAGMAGVAGALFGGLRITVSAGDFQPLQSLFLFLVATFGGITTVIGALFAGVFLALVPELQKHISIENIQPIGIGLGAIGLAGGPHGFGGHVSQAGAAIRGALTRSKAPAAPPPPEPSRPPVREKVGAR